GACRQGPAERGPPGPHGTVVVNAGPGPPTHAVPPAPPHWRSVVQLGRPSTPAADGKSRWPMQSSVRCDLSTMTGVAMVSSSVRTQRTALAAWKGAGQSAATASAAAATGAPKSYAQPPRHPNTI